MCAAQVYFDKMMGVEPYKAQACTPYHTCCFLALCGEVYVLAPHPVMANCCCLNTCPCLFKMYPGLEDAQALVDFTKAARDDFAKRKGARAVLPFAAQSVTCRTTGWGPLLARMLNCRGPILQASRAGRAWRPRRPFLAPTRKCQHHERQSEDAQHNGNCMRARCKLHASRAIPAHFASGVHCRHAGRKLVVCHKLRRRSNICICGLRGSDPA